MRHNVKPGEIYWTKDVATINRFGERILKNRPTLIVTNSCGLKNSGICTVIPLSSKIEKVHKTNCNVLVGNFLPKPSVTISEQLTTISQTQLLGEPIEKLDEVQFSLVKDAVKRQLGLQ